VALEVYGATSPAMPHFSHSNLTRTRMDSIRERILLALFTMPVLWFVHKSIGITELRGGFQKIEFWY